MDIEKGEFLQKDSDFRSYEWTQGRRMTVRCIVQDKNGDNQLPLENKEHLRGKTKNRLKHSFSKYNFFMHVFEKYVNDSFSFAAALFSLASGVLRH
ncbi:hypothetical protein TL16_g12558 [Triparma laevis f. inornata]|uniref:Uncharacterized protein n=1 Tax=Triparma laevis f. inornata TaxID=1714386 RepID=A0A9W7EVE6_9STRA|nr:hypothetical protein TL16_g12558 [Triparma laevis f. inornata]